MKNIINVVKNLPNSFDKFTAPARLKTKKYLPEIMLTGSLITGAAAIVTTVISSLKIKDKFEDIDEEYEDERENKKEKVKEVCKSYVTPASLAVTSTALGIGAFAKMKGRYIGAVAAYNGIKIAFDDYRERVVNDQGSEKDFEYMYGATTETETITKKEKKTEQHVDSILPGLSQYAIIWDEYLPDGTKNYQWDTNTNFNYMFLKTQESIANDLLKSRGHVFLNEVLDSIGYPHTQAGAVVGWVKGYGDDIIDFGLYNNETEKVKRFVNGNPNTIILDFNVDGVIYDLI